MESSSRGQAGEKKIGQILNSDEAPDAFVSGENQHRSRTQPSYGDHPKLHSARISTRHIEIEAKWVGCEHRRRCDQRVNPNLRAAVLNLPRKTLDDALHGTLT